MFDLGDLFQLGMRHARSYKYSNSAVADAGQPRQRTANTADSYPYLFANPDSRANSYTDTHANPYAPSAPYTLVPDASVSSKEYYFPRRFRDAFCGERVGIV